MIGEWNTFPIHKVKSIEWLNDVVESNCGSACAHKIICIFCTTKTLFSRALINELDKHENWNISLLSSKNKLRSKQPAIIYQSATQKNTNTEWLEEKCTTICTQHQILLRRCIDLKKYFENRLVLTTATTVALPMPEIMRKCPQHSC